MSQTGPQQLSAAYASPTTTNMTFSSTLPRQPAEGNILEKTAYLRALRSGISQMQDEINIFLTEQMASEKASNDGGGNTTSTAQERKEEDFYGEVDPEDDEDDH